MKTTRGFILKYWTKEYITYGLKWKESYLIPACTIDEIFEKLNKDFTYIGIEEFLKTLEHFEEKQEYIKQRYITAVNALEYIVLAKHVLTKGMSRGEYINI